MVLLNLQKAMQLNGIEDWTLTPPQQKFSVESTNDLLQNHDELWFNENQARLRKELEIVFEEI